MNLYSEPIEVELPEGEIAPSPVAFTWRGERHVVTEILSAWQDAGFADAAKHHRWWERRHRNYHRLRTEDGSAWEVYLDRGAGRRRWYVSRHWNPGEEM